MDHGFAVPLCYAIRCQCDIEIIQLLVDHGAKSDDCDPRGNTPAKMLHRHRLMNHAEPEEPAPPDFMAIPGHGGFAVAVNNPDPDPEVQLMNELINNMLDTERVRNARAAEAAAREQWYQQVAQLLNLPAE